MFLLNAPRLLSNKSLKFDGSADYNTNVFFSFVYLFPAILWSEMICIINVYGSCRAKKGFIYLKVQVPVCVPFILCREFLQLHLNLKHGKSQIMNNILMHVQAMI